MKRQLIAGLVGMLALVMAGCGGAGGGNVGQDIISGKVSRAGGSVAGTLVAACDVNDLCNQQDPAADGSYKLSGLRSGQSYAIIAIQFVDPDNNPDFVGIYSADGKNITPVTPPKSNVNFALQAVTAGSLEVKPQFLHR
ncbi:hypothetical protein Mesil_2959 [Allomeiothermus silvanus DSM 9946]|uniref:Carboxypeptidase regulatory-like domain-containing protein n=1 Tax=Allomeiothermus silvanus (strain ATCC 700542 / DSM 9946 / NBRC 106475 / NCIMB 13440 / VI-R2) TaxID=526227 RepID=D7BDH8_ALLS1|nr:hypothetical protein [Allomeiothermus silvanus]ADH64798.1 hypothetical protein Mesil_2959 [Allomeiothermus silvanus DSM 9946]